MTSSKLCRMADMQRFNAQWYFTRKELQHTPSRADGMPAEREAADRTKGINFILQVGMTLKLPQLTLATASAFYHRFYMRKSFTLHHPYDIGATCLFLATKVEETGRKLRDIIVVCVQKAQKSPDLVVDDNSKEFWRWRDVILFNEELVLEALCFDLSVDHPYKPLLSFVRQFNLSKKLAQTSWAFVNDSLRTTLCVQYRPHVIAAAAMYVAAKFTSETLPQADGKAWWQVVDADIHEIKDISNEILDQYISSSARKSANGKRSRSPSPPSSRSPSSKLAKTEDHKETPRKRSQSPRRSPRRSPPNASRSPPNLSRRSSPRSSQSQRPSASLSPTDRPDGSSSARPPKAPRQAGETAKEGNGDNEAMRLENMMQSEGIQSMKDLEDGEVEEGEIKVI